MLPWYICIYWSLYDHKQNWSCYVMMLLSVCRQNCGTLWCRSSWICIPTFESSCAYRIYHHYREGLCGSLGKVVGLPNNSYKPIINTVCVSVRLCKLQKGSTRLAAASDKVYQLLFHGQLFSAGKPDSSTTKTGRHDIAEILLKVVLNTINQIKSNISCLDPSVFFEGYYRNALCALN